LELQPDTSYRAIVKGCDTLQLVVNALQILPTDESHGIYLDRFLDSPLEVDPPLAKDVVHRDIIAGSLARHADFSVIPDPDLNLAGSELSSAVIAVTGFVVACVRAKVGDTASEEVAERFFVVNVELNVISTTAAQDHCFESFEVWLEVECTGVVVEAHQVCVLDCEEGRYIWKLWMRCLEN